MKLSQYKPIYVFYVISQSLLDNEEDSQITHIGYTDDEVKSQQIVQDWNDTATSLFKKLEELERLDNQKNPKPDVIFHLNKVKHSTGQDVDLLSFLVKDEYSIQKEAYTQELLKSNKASALFKQLWLISNLTNKEFEIFNQGYNLDNRAVCHVKELDYILS